MARMQLVLPKSNVESNEFLKLTKSRVVKKYSNQMKLVKSNSVSYIKCNWSKQKTTLPLPSANPTIGRYENWIAPNNQNPSNQMKIFNKKENSNRPRQIPLPQKKNWHYAHNIALSGNSPFKQNLSYFIFGFFNVNWIG